MSLWPAVSRLAARTRARLTRSRRLRERAEALELLQRIANAANESSTSDQALERAIDEICKATGWSVGHVYVREPGFPQLAPRSLWHLDDPDRWTPFVELSDTLHFISGHGLPGRVLERGEPIRLDAIAGDPTMPRAGLAAELGVRAAFAFPVIVDREVAAVLEFFSTEPIALDDRLADLAGPIAVQLARVLERERSQAALRASEERFRSLVANVPGAIYRMSAEVGQRRVDFVSDDIENILGYPAHAFVSGRLRAADIVHPGDLPKVEAATAAAVASGDPFSIEYRMLHRDGRIRWVSENGRAVHDEITGETWLDGVLVDVTERRRAALLLRSAEDRYRTLVEQLPLITYIDVRDGELESSHRSRYVSPQVETLLGWTAEEWLEDDRFFEKVVHPDDQERVIAAHQLAYAEESGFTLEYRLLARDGQVHWFVDHMVIARDEHGQPLWSQGYLRDITDRKEAEGRLLAAEVRYRTLVEQLPLATYIDAPEGLGTSTYVSPQIEQLLGYAPDEWEAGLFERVLHPEDRDRVLTAVREATAAGEPVSHEYRVVRRDGRVAWWRDSAVVVRDARGNPLYRQGFVVDVTERQEAQQRLHEQNEELRTLDRMKDELVALVSHELRTPLTSIRGYVELLLEPGYGELNEEQEQFLRIALRNADRLHAIVGDLLFMAQLEAGRITLDRGLVDLGAVAAEAVDTGRPHADSKGISLSLDAADDVWVEGDRVRLGQLIDNFVSNALKFTSESGHVDVRIRREGGRATIEVADTGMGIPADEQRRLFERFFRSSTASQHAIQGTGLGLTISKAIVDGHGGDISFTSAEGNGTTFRIELPLATDLTAETDVQEAA